MLPDAVRAVTIAADADKVGLREARAAARRWEAEGRFVRIIAPAAADQDFNDMLRQDSAASAADGGNNDGSR